MYRPSRPFILTLRETEIPPQNKSGNEPENQLIKAKSEGRHRMRRLFPLHTNRTLITHLTGMETPDQIVAEVRGAEFDGADAVALELRQLKPEFRSRKTLETIINSAALPFMVLFYRNDQWNPDSTDETRQQLLFEALEAGAGMIDVMGDLYDPSPDERTRNPAAIARQMKDIAAIHAAGAQVIISSHPNRAMTADEVADQLKSFEDRGADVVKIVTAANTEEEFSEAIRTTLRLRHELKTPFVHLCNGTFGRLQRFVGLSLGVAITFGVHEFHPGGYSQPKITALKAVQDNIHWQIDRQLPLK